MTFWSRNRNAQRVFAALRALKLRMQTWRFRRLLPKTLQPDSIPYVTEYVLPASFVGFSEISKCPGLFFHFVVQEPIGKPSIFVACWYSKEHSLRDEAQLRHSLGVGDAQSTGHLAQLTFQPKPWWTRIGAWYTFAVSAVALFATLDALGIHYDKIFLRPDFEVRPDKPRIDVVEGVLLEGTWGINNPLPVSLRNIKLTAELDGQTVSGITVSKLTRVPADTSRQFSVYGLMPTVGHYTLRIRARGNAGLFRGSQEYQRTQEIYVWPRRPRGTITLKEETNQGNEAVLRGSVVMGRLPNTTLDCVLETHGIRGLQYISTTYPVTQDAEWLDGESTPPGKEVAALTLKADNLKGERELTFTVVYALPPGLVGRTIVSQSHLNCSDTRTLPP